MRAVSDLGGLPAGPVVRDEHGPSDRDRRIDAMKSIVQSKDEMLTSDCSRRAQEELSADLYDTLPYYDRWLLGLRKNLVERGYLSDAEIEERMKALRMAQPSA